MNIVCLHQSSDLYGSDRSFLQVVEFLSSSGKFTKITIILPREGPLVPKLQALHVEIVYWNLSLLSKTFLKKLQFGKILFPLLKMPSKKRFLKSYDIVYCNTSVILDFYLIAPFLRNKKILHIREIPAPWLAKFLNPLIRKTNAIVIFNSESTKASFGPIKNSEVIYNAFEGFENNVSDHVVKDEKKVLKMLLIGRINTWKGQDFAIEAISHLAAKNNVLLKIVGSTSAGNEILLEKLKLQVADLGLKESVQFEEFSNDPTQFFLWADMIIVPSKKPEPFGRIAIEAMSASKPVVAANHGGLMEIVIDEECGYLFEPNNISSFVSKLEKYIKNPELSVIQGKRAKEIFDEKFSIDNLHQSLTKIILF